MIFVDREEELGRLERLARRREGGLAVVYGRRRLGKTRLLLEWLARHAGLYSVADLSTASVQRRYFARAVADRLAGFDEVEYPDWRGLLLRLARDARGAGWRGPLVLDELPYLVAGSPELPSVLQHWIEHEARSSRLVVALCGSSQRMMQGLVLDAGAPLFGRAQEVIELAPLGPEHIATALGLGSPSRAVEAFTAWGGVPRYWELAAEAGPDRERAVDRLVLDRLGPLHGEPDRLLVEELPPATEVRPILDAIGAGAHRVSEIAGRIGRPATSLARPLERLQELGLVRREVPFGEPERSGKRSLYRISDPFLRLWFRVVAPHRARLAAADGPARRALLRRFWPQLAGEAWEELCRLRFPALGDWGPPARWWWRNEPEWDVVTRSADGRRLLVGEARFSARPFGRRALEQAARDVAARPLPPLVAGASEVQRALFVPELVPGLAPPRGLRVVTAAELLAL